MLPHTDIEQALGQRLSASKPISGGDICEAYLITLDNGKRLFVKTRPNAPKEMFPAEGKGLKWLAETDSLRLPEVVAAEPTFLALELLEPGPRQKDFDKQLGEGLAKMHKASASEPGLDHDNFIGPLPQPNDTRNSWPEFYAEQRLRPRVLEAVQSGIAPQSWEQKFEKLFQKLPQIIPDEPYSRLHGDLWGGNLHTGPNGEPCLIDPAVYVGHREVDLAMMRLFGGFSNEVFDSYHHAYPLEAGHQDRVKLYQLYPLLVHVVLFGGGYVSSVNRVLEQYTWRFYKPF